MPHSYASEEANGIVLPLIQELLCIPFTKSQLDYPAQWHRLFSTRLYEAEF